MINFALALQPHSFHRFFWSFHLSATLVTSPEHGIPLYCASFPCLHLYYFIFILVFCYFLSYSMLFHCPSRSLPFILFHHRLAKFELTFYVPQNGAKDRTLFRFLFSLLYNCVVRSFRLFPLIHCPSYPPTCLPPLPPCRDVGRWNGKRSQGSSGKGKARN